MPLTLPDLDTRRFDELVVEGRSRIPLHAGDWTDHNVSDPGIALIELLATHVERDVYRANRVPDRNRRKLLALAGERLHGPRAGRAVVAAAPAPGSPQLLPAGVELRIEHGDAALAATTLAALPLVQGAVRAVQTMDGDEATDLTAQLTASPPLQPLGPDPAPDAALAIGIDAALGAGDALTLHLGLDDPGHDGPPGDEDAATAALGLDPLRHHGARTVWEVLAAGGWVELPAASVSDPTRALSRPGVVALTIPVAVAPATLGPVSAPLAWLRCRLAEGRPDRAPALRSVTANAVEVRFATPAFASYPIASTATIPPTGPIVAGAEAQLAFSLDGEGRIDRLVAGPAVEAPPVAVLDYVLPTTTKPGRLAIEAAWLTTGDGTPEQVAMLAGAPVLDDARAWTLETDGAHAVRLRDDLDASGRRDRDAVLDPAEGALRFGDGHNGRAPADGAALLAAWSATSGGAAAALRPPAVAHLATGTRNQLLLGGDPTAVDGDLRLSLLTPVLGAADGDDVAAAAARAERRVWAHERLVGALEAAGATTLDELDRAAVARLAVPERAVTLADHERIALATPGCRIARARAWPEMHPDLAAGLRAAGCVTIVVVPWLPDARPEPTEGLLGAVRRTFAPRRLVGTRIYVSGPTYVEVDVAATVAVVPGSDPAAAGAAVRAALERFLHPLRGGPDGRGWPFGRHVYRSEVMQVVDAAAGVDHVEELTVALQGEPPSCGNLCVPPTALVVAGTLAVEATP